MMAAACFPSHVLPCGVWLRCCGVHSQLGTLMLWMSLLTVSSRSCCCCRSSVLSSDVRCSCCFSSSIVPFCSSTSFFSCSFSSCRLFSSACLWPSMSSTRFSRKLKKKNLISVTVRILTSLFDLHCLTSWRSRRSILTYYNLSIMSFVFPCPPPTSSRSQENKNITKLCCGARHRNDDHVCYSLYCSVFALNFKYFH